MKAKFLSQKYTKGLSSSMPCVLDVRGYHPDHHKEPQPSCCREARIAIGAHCNSSGFYTPQFPVCIFLEGLPSCFHHTSLTRWGGAEAHLQQPETLLDTHLTTTINSKALSTFRTETTSSTVTCTDKQN